MGFAFIFLFVYILLPLTGILLFLWLITKKKIFGITVGLIWFTIFGLSILSEVVQFLSSKTKLKRKDYYGHYIINRDYFPGRQSDWQYENFRFEIKKNDSIYFYVTEKEKILKTYRGTISTTDPHQYSSERLIINIDQPTHHIIIDNPTTYRSAWSFYLVFYSTKFNNVYFKKGKWKPLENRLQK